VALPAVVYDPLYGRGQLRRGGVEEVAQQVYLRVLPACADLDARHHFNAQFFALFPGLGKSAHRVVVGDCHGGKAGFFGQEDKLCRRKCPIGFCCVGMEVDGFHHIISFSSFSAFSYIFPGSPPMKNSPFSYSTLPFIMVRRTFSFEPA